MKGLVLVIEDDLDLRESFKDVLELDGLSVITAENGAVAIEKLKSTNPSLIFLDLYMPIMNGVEFLEQMGEELKSKNIPVILCTAAHPQHEEYQKALPLVKSIMKKPVQVNDILDAAEKFCC